MYLPKRRSDAHEIRTYVKKSQTTVEDGLEHNVSFLKSQIHSQLLAMEVDSKVQHDSGLLCVKVVEENRHFPTYLSREARSFMLGNSQKHNYPIQIP